MNTSTITPPNKRQWLLTLALVTAVLGTLTACGEEDTAPTVQPIRPVKLLEVKVGNNEKNASFPAIIEASATSQLTFEVGGTVDELLVREGQDVEQNQVIARLDQRNYKNDLAAAQTQYDSAQAEYRRAKNLVAENAIARNVFEQRKTQRNVARTTLDNALKAIEDTELRAPFKGVVADLSIEQFENISPGSVAAIVQSTGAAEAVVQVPASLVANSENMEPLATDVVLDAAPGVLIPATFHSASAQADQSTQTFEVKFAFTPPEGLLILPGMTGTVKSRVRVLGDEASANRMLINLSAIGSDGDDRFTWLVDTEKMTVSKRKITVGSSIGDELIVLDGLEPGDTIVGAGMSYLHEGMQIRPYEQ